MATAKSAKAKGKPKSSKRRRKTKSNRVSPQPKSDEPYEVVVGVPGPKWRLLRDRMGSATDIMADEIRRELGLDSIDHDDAKHNSIFACCGQTEQTIVDKITENHKAMEPLVCLNSCLVVEGCRVVLGCEIVTLVCASAVSILELYKHNWWWLSDPSGYANAITHYSVVFHLLLLLMVTPSMVGGLVHYEYKPVNCFLRIQMLSILLSLCQLVLCVLALILESYWSFSTLTLIILLIINCTVQIWGIPVVLTCLDYFRMLKVFADMNEED